MTKIEIATTYLKRLEDRLEFAEAAIPFAKTEEEKIEYQIEAVLVKHFLNDTKELLAELLDGETK